MEQYFGHPWFFKHAVLESFLVGLSGSVYVAAAGVEAGGGVASCSWWLTFL